MNKMLTAINFSYSNYQNNKNKFKNRQILSFLSNNNSLTKEPRIFIAMPMTHKKWDDLRDKIIKIAESKKFKAFRIDNIVKHNFANTSSHDLKNNIFEGIDSSDIVIADISERNPNVYFELGYAMGKGKKILPMAMKDTNLPFDVQSIWTTFYKNRKDDFEQKLTDSLNDYMNATTNK